VVLRGSVKKNWVHQLVIGTRAKKNSHKNFGSNRFLFKKFFFIAIRAFNDVGEWGKDGGLQVEECYLIQTFDTRHDLETDATFLSEADELDKQK
jgi:hypothetical protein